jgi:hypothetical protein
MDENATTIFKVLPDIFFHDRGDMALAAGKYYPTIVAKHTLSASMVAAL